MAAATFVTFLPVVWNGFVTGTTRMLLENPTTGLRGLACRRGASVLGSTPVTWMTYALDRTLWDLHAPGYRESPAPRRRRSRCTRWLGACSSTLGPDRRESGARDRVGAAVAALAFALHPLRAEPVAWLSARM